MDEARAKAFEGLYKVLGTKEGEKSVCRLKKRKETKTRDLDQVKCINDEELWSFGSRKINKGLMDEIFSQNI